MEGSLFHRSVEITNIQELNIFLNQKTIGDLEKHKIKGSKQKKTLSMDRSAALFSKVYPENNLIYICLF